MSTDQECIICNTTISDRFWSPAVKSCRDCNHIVCSNCLFKDIESTPASRNYYCSLCKSTTNIMEAVMKSRSEDQRLTLNQKISETEDSLCGVLGEEIVPDSSKIKKSLTCEICLKTFNSTAAKSHHRESHEKRKKCTFCPVTFTRLDNKKTHERKCKGKSFSS